MLGCMQGQRPLRFGGVGGLCVAGPFAETTSRHSVVKWQSKAMTPSPDPRKTALNPSCTLNGCLQCAAIIRLPVNMEEVDATVKRQVIASYIRKIWVRGQEVGMAPTALQ